MTTVQKLGAAAALIAAFVGVILGTRTPTNPVPTRSCIPFEGAKPGGLSVTRAVVGLSPRAQTLLGLSPVDGWAYALMEVQSVDQAQVPDLLGKLLDNVEVVGEMWDRTAQGAAFPACQIALARQDDALFTSDTACSCSTGASCNYVVGGALAPKRVTFDPGVVTGTGCRRTPCTDLLGFPYFPAVCQ